MTNPNKEAQPPRPPDGTQLPSSREQNIEIHDLIYTYDEGDIDATELQESLLGLFWEWIRAATPPRESDQATIRTQQE